MKLLRKIRIHETISIAFVNIVILVGVVLTCNQYVGLLLKENLQYTDMYDRFYVDPAGVHVQFPEKKQNIIMVYLESIENTFASIQSGGSFNDSLIPNLEAIANDPNTTRFSSGTKLGGSKYILYAHWTIASWLAMQAGIPMKAHLFKDTLFFPQITTLGDIFGINGYDMYLGVPYKRNMHGASFLFQTHGNTTIFGTEDIKKVQRIPRGFFHVKLNELCDAVLYNYTYRVLPKIAQKGKPFVYVFETLDTHFPDGKYCPLCRHDSTTKFNCVRKCADRQIGQFVRWFKKQPFYHNTTLFLVGDHFVMGGDLERQNITLRTRTVYNAMINPVVKPRKERTINRNFMPYDWVPTILTAIGAKVYGGRLALGTDLYSDLKTLGEHNYDYWNEVQKKSKFYENRIVGEVGKPHVRLVCAWKPINST